MHAHVRTYVKRRPDSKMDTVRKICVHSGNKQKPDTPPARQAQISSWSKLPVSLRTMQSIDCALLNIRIFFFLCMQILKCTNAFNR